MSDFKPVGQYVTIEEEFEDRTKKAFESGCDYIVAYSRVQHRFQIEAALYCEQKGWVTQGEGVIQTDEQSSEIRWRLTPEGRKHWNIPAKDEK